jgi:peptidoglycan/xylan/chitin deacetylase (PgdA/CDA1 family)
VHHERAAVLTYDDGPTPGVTDVLLDLLAERGATATFFVLLTRVRRSPALLAEVIAAGHEVALHGLDHRRLTEVRRRSLPALIREARAELEDTAGVPVRWFRPPYGAHSRASWAAAHQAGLTTVQWSVACRDWLTLPPAEYLVNLDGRDLSGEVVLLHDGYADASDCAHDGPEPVLDRRALSGAVLDRVEAQGLRATSLGGALRTGTPEFDVRLAVSGWRSRAGALLR